MKEIIVTTQQELDALPDRFDEYTNIVIKGKRYDWIAVNKARENSSVEARENSSVEAWENSSVVARENSSVVARENSSVEAWENSSVEAWENSSVVARENSSVVAWENSVVRVLSASVKLALHGFSVAFLPITINLKIEKKSEHSHIQVVQELGWFECNAVDKTATVVLYKRVSSDFKTQENKKNETLWQIGSTVEHPAWNPSEAECGEGKFHACSRPYFCDEFRSTKGDRYVAIEIAAEDLYEWTKFPDYPHKIGFRKGTVMYECDRFGKKLA
jgi:hypothetical protein